MAWEPHLCREIACPEELNPDLLLRGNCSIRLSYGQHAPEGRIMRNPLGLALDGPKKNLLALHPLREIRRKPPAPPTSTLKGKSLLERILSAAIHPRPASCGSAATNPRPRKGRPYPPRASNTRPVPPRHRPSTMRRISLRWAGLSAKGGNRAGAHESACSRATARSSACSNARDIVAERTNGSRHLRRRPHRRCGWSGIAHGTPACTGTHGSCNSPAASPQPHKVIEETNPETGSAARSRSALHAAACCSAIS